MADSWWIQSSNEATKKGKPYRGLREIFAAGEFGIPKKYKTR